MKIAEHEIARVAEQLPASPRIVAKLAEVLNDMNSDTSDVVDLVKIDAGITSALIRLSNSALFAYSEPSTTLDEAIGRVGFREVYRLVGLASTRQLVPKHLAIYSLNGDTMWEDSIATALAMEALARKSGSVDEKTAYTIGLLRSSGRIVISRLAGDASGVEPYPGEHKEPYLNEWEERQFGLSGGEACATLMRHWKYSDAIADAIRFQATPLDAPDAPTEAYLLNVAGWVAMQVGGGIPGETLYWRRHPEKFARAKISAEDAESTVEKVKEGLEGLRAAIASAKL